MFVHARELRTTSDEARAFHQSGLEDLALTTMHAATVQCGTSEVPADRAATLIKRYAASLEQLIDGKNQLQLPPDHVLQALAAGGDYTPPVRLPVSPDVWDGWDIEDASLPATMNRCAWQLVEQELNAPSLDHVGGLADAARMMRHAISLDKGQDTNAIDTLIHLDVLLARYGHAMPAYTEPLLAWAETVAPASVAAARSLWNEQPASAV